MINEELCKITERLKINKLSLNIVKSKYITFQIGNRSAQDLILKIDSINIKHVKEFYFLGLILY